MPLPLTVIATVITASIITGTANALNQLITKVGNAALKIVIVLGSPVCTVCARNCIVTRERNVKDVVLIMTAIAVDTSTVTGSG